MTHLKIFAVPIMTAALLLSGCTSPVDTPPAPPSQAKEDINPLTKAQVVSLLSEAAILEQVFYDTESLTTDEVYAHFQSVYTQQYVDRIILGTGNFKRENEKWIFAYRGGELVEGSFINEPNLEGLKVEVSFDGKTMTVTNPVGDGLYAPHLEIITLAFTDNTWKINHLEWVKKH
ncbi:hypothetical protein [Ammoniphilus sp. YIM 78166]|uniref:hypothetical protein n=1 Tax=Ammoniphilus sp. YIM 78166 TaxID=1644106 RepID=UPI00106F800E|nr:hypothetical protein [Ammoniphilus sp. YIM 78166]